MSKYWSIFAAAIIYVIGAGIGERWIKRRYPDNKALRIIPYVVMIFVCVLLRWGLDQVFPSEN